MLEIHERTDTQGYEKIISGIQDDNIHIVESINGKEVNGYGVYSFNENGLNIYDFNSDEREITDGIIRTILFKGLLGGLNSCNFSIADKEKHEKLISLGFIKADVNLIDNIGEFMGGCQNCGEFNMNDIDI